VTRPPALATASQVRASELARLTRRTAELEAELNRLRDVNRALKRFVAEAAHEMTEPLVIAESSAMLLGEDFREDVNPALRARLDRLGTAASRGRSLAEALLLDARAEQCEPELARVDLGELVNDALSLVADRLEAGSPRIAIAPMPTVLSNRPFLSVIVRNLVVNAVKHSSQGSGLRIEADRETAAWRLSVVSPGPILGAEEAERLLRPFERGDGARHVAGTGLGLAICVRLAERIGGALGHAPEPGVGNRFFVRLPAEATARAQGPAGSTATATSDESPPAVAC
jgi:signal transduction histidine kinase